MGSRGLIYKTCSFTPTTLASFPVFTHTHTHARARALAEFAEHASSFYSSDLFRCNGVTHILTWEVPGKTMVSTVGFTGGVNYLAQGEVSGSY